MKLIFWTATAVTTVIRSQPTSIRKSTFGKFLQRAAIFANGKWVETEPMEIKRVYNFDEVGEKDMYLLHHEELESLALNIKGIHADPVLYDVRTELSDPPAVVWKMSA